MIVINNVDQLLSARSFLDTLRAQRLEVVRATAPKQTETTQRWKIGLRVPASGTELPTKIEFSRRDGNPAADVAQRESWDRLQARVVEALEAWQK